MLTRTNGKKIARVIAENLTFCVLQIKYSAFIGADRFGVLIHYETELRLRTCVNLKREKRTKSEYCEKQLFHNKIIKRSLSVFLTIVFRSWLNSNSAQPWYIAGSCTYLHRTRQIHCGGNVYCEQALTLMI